MSEKPQIFETPVAQAEEATDVAAPKKRRKRKPMTDEQKKAFGQKMREARERKAKQMADKIVAEQSGNQKPGERPAETPVPEAKAKQPRAKRKDTSNKIVPQNNVASLPQMDYSYFTNLNSSIVALNQTLTRLGQAREAPAPPKRQAPEPKKEATPAAKATPPQSSNQKPQENKPKQNTSSPAPSSLPEKKKVWNIKRRCYVYI
jgi:hypothetical protein